MYKRKERKIFDKKFMWISLGFFAFIVIILFFPYLFTSYSWFGLNFSKTGEVGDTLGGILGPFVAIAAAILTFLAFWVQYAANEQQKHDLQIERFENKFYTMIEILRQNIAEVTIGKSLTGRKAFISMFNELRFLFLATDKFFKTPSQKALILQITKKESFSEEEVYNIAYLIFFFGIGQNSTKMILSLMKKEYGGLVLNLEAFLIVQQVAWRQDGRKLSIEETTHEGEATFTLRTTYKPFNGHMSRLSHYLRHLFQLVKYIDDQPEKVMDYSAKYDYAATIRAQLSTHEQLLLYYNALSVLGKPWFDKKFLKKYCMVKSMPVPLADFYKEPLEVLPENNEEGRPVFEWTEIRSRLN